MAVRKYMQPSGWRIEQKYATGVLLGNWSENRLGKFNSGSHPPGSSTQREDYKSYSTRSYHPDILARTKALLRNDGLNKDQIFTHHGNQYMNNLISSYDQHYNRKHTVGIRHWNLYHIAWLPEASDNPLQGVSTNFGLQEEKEKKIKAEQNQDSDYDTEHSVSYRPYPADTTQIKRLATPRHLSARLHPYNKLLKNLQLRSAPLIGRPEIVDSKLLRI